jgi:pyridinium-3,5-biscarboxylic acid mononucleotide sulfurtransferase
METYKLNKLDSILKELKSFVVAFSGGVDSTFLLHWASCTEGVKVGAVTIKTPYIPAHEINDATNFCKYKNIDHKLIDVPISEIIRQNPVERCYLCKKTLFDYIITYAREENFNFIVDGTNADDKGEFRPGLKALAEMGIRSPLMESGLTKNEIRKLSQNAGLPWWDKPSNACLLTRIPYGTTITENDLRMIEDAEQYLFEKGFPGTRVRMHGNIARIECIPGYFGRMVQETERLHIIDKLKKIGFRYILLDIEGYRTGSLNTEI